MQDELNRGLLVKSMTMVMLATLASRVLGFFREVAVAYRFGATTEADAYLVAILLPTILFYSFSDALKSTFITVFAPFKGGQDEHHFVNTLAFYTIGVLLILALLGYLLAPQLVFLLAPGFTGETFQLTVELTRILIPGVFFIGLSGLATGFLHSHQRFIVPALVNVPHNIIVILSALYLSLHYGVYGLAWGSLVAVSSQLLIQLPSLRRTTFKFRRGLSSQHPGLKKVTALLPAILLSSAVLELKHILDRLFASFLQPGSIAALNYAERIYMLPQALFVSTIIVILYPTLVELLGKRDMDAFNRQIKWGISMFFFLLLPVMAGMVILRRPLVEVLFQRGAFDGAATDLTAYALLFYTPALLGFSLHCFCNRIYFALQDVKTLVKVNISMVAANAVFNLILMPFLGHGGIALGTSLAFSLGAVWLLAILSHRIGISFGDLVQPIYRSTLAALIMVAVLLIYLYAWIHLLERPFAGLSVLASTAFLGAAVYFLSARLLRISEMNLLLRLVKEYVGRKLKSS